MALRVDVLIALTPLRTQQKPKLLLGKCQYKNSAYKGDILKDNDVDIQDNEVSRAAEAQRACS
jgi:hypothetical protein